MSDVMPMIVRLILCVIGVNKESAEKDLATTIEKLKQESNLVFYKCNSNPAENTENNLWTTYAEVELEAENFKRFLSLCVNYLPSNVEILDPLTVEMDSYSISDTLNGILSKLQESKKIILKTPNLGNKPE